MRILLITPFPPDQPGPDGMTLIAYYLIRYLSAHHQVTVWSSTTHPLNAKLWKHYLTLDHLPWYARKRLAGELMQALAKADLPYDLVYLHSPFSLGYMGSVRGLPVVAGVIDTMSDWFHQAMQFEPNPFKRLHYHHERRLSQRLETQLLHDQKVKRLIVVSPSDQQKLGASDKIRVIPNGVDTATFKPDQSVTKQASIIFTGMMNYSPNEDAVQFFYREIWPSLRSTNLRWFIVGKHPTTMMRKLAQRDTQITVTGMVPTIVPYLQKAQIYVAPVRFGTGIKNKLLEAMACELPVIALASSVSGLEQAPITVATEANFAVTIQRLLQNATERQQLGAANRRYIEAHHTWNAVCAQYERVFTEAVQLQ